MVAIQISDEVAAALEAKAAEEGLTLEGWFRRLAGLRRPGYTLAELLSQCDLDAPASDEDRQWLEDAPVGREVL